MHPSWLFWIFWYHWSWYSFGLALGDGLRRHYIGLAPVVGREEIWLQASVFSTLLFNIYMITWLRSSESLGYSVTSMLIIFSFISPPQVIWRMLWMFCPNAEHPGGCEGLDGHNRLWFNPNSTEWLWEFGPPGASDLPSWFWMGYHFFRQTYSSIWVLLGLMVHDLPSELLQNILHRCRSIWKRHLVQNAVV